MSLAIFDLDETLIAGDSATLWLQWLVAEGHAPAELLAQEASLMQRYRLGELRMEDYLALTLQPLVGKTAAEVERWVERFMVERIEPIVYSEGMERLAKYRAQGWTLLLISATSEHLVLPIARLMGIPHAMGIQLELEDGRYTGRPHGVLTYQAGKVRRLEQWLSSRGHSLDVSHGYSDSVNDLPLLLTVGQAHVINPCQRLRAEAENRQWPILDWRQFG